MRGLRKDDPGGGYVHYVDMRGFILKVDSDCSGWNAAAVHFAEGRLPGTAPLIPDEELSVE